MKNLVYIFLFPFMLVSCSDWLDVKPKTAIQEKDLFTTESGFKDALTGLYIELGNETLYGNQLTMGFIDRLARRYEYPRIVSYQPLYNYEGQYEGTVAGIYAKMYNIIANTNNLLLYLDKNRAVLHTQHYYEIIRGEALGLRAYLHFELLRMFGPVYRLEPKGESICYRTHLDKYATPILPAEQVVDSIERDLLVAQELLDEHEPETFVANEEDQDQDAFLRLRQLRMNKYAVKALLARLYCYKGDAGSKKMACDYANEVIACKSFALQMVNKSNPILFNEHVFSIHVYELDKIVKKLFEDKQGENNLCITKQMLDQIYGDPNASKDMRKNEIAFYTGTGDVKIPMKYNQSVYDYSYNGKEIVPLIRLPEMYYILAECEVSAEESRKALQAVRTVRVAYGNLPAVERWDKLSDVSAMTPDALQTVRINEIMKEYMKEFYAEGQLFYFYKKYNFKMIYPGQAMQTTYYRFKMPVDEEIFGNKN